MMRVSVGNTEFTASFLEWNTKKNKCRQFPTDLCFKVFILGECKKPSSEILIENIES